MEKNQMRSRTEQGHRAELSGPGQLCRGGKAMAISSGRGDGTPTESRRRGSGRTMAERLPRGESPAATDIRVFLVDRQEIVLRGLNVALGGEPDISIDGEAVNVLQAMARIRGDHAPDVVIIDPDLPDGRGLDLCRLLRTRFDGVRCVVLTASTDPDRLAESMVAGASAYVVKDVVGPELAATIRIVDAGGTSYDPRVVRELRTRVGRTAVLDQLSPRERRMFAMLGKGLTNRQMAERLFIAEKTVRNSLTVLFAKLGVSGRVQAAALAVKIGVVDTSLAS
ncbi:response regulator transcription factor [Nocardia sp. MH4]|uniref:response regulator n=1 Tax=Nocardia sp. MH4 TaxID=1768677 RepID=UPI001C4F5787|nr:response regulator transcription factor [Nocardia sp. MH4]